MLCPPPRIPPSAPPFPDELDKGEAPTAETLVVAWLLIVLDGEGASTEVEVALELEATALMVDPTPRELVVGCVAAGDDGNCEMEVTTVVVEGLLLLAIEEPLPRIEVRPSCAFAKSVCIRRPTSTTLKKPRPAMVGSPRSCNGTPSRLIS